MVWVLGKSGRRGCGFWCQLGFGYMIMVMYSRLVEALNRP